MRTTVTIPDDLFVLAEAEASKLSISRSEFYARALAKSVKRKQDDDITAPLNEVYGEMPAEIDPFLMELQLRTLPKGKW